MKKFNFFVVLFLSSLFVLSCGTSGGVVKPVESKAIAMNPAISTGKLSNGMTYFVQENHEPKNRIYLRLVVKAGSAMEEENQKGLAHFIEHMAFNGTKNFEKSAIIDYFEKIGMGFGPEVNAYTSFEETVYMLEIPADDPQMLLTSLNVLHDWACEISFEEEEVEKERGVIIEEWRLGQGLNNEITNSQLAFLLKGSKLSERKPIGETNIISTAPRSELINFYKKWYRPEFMSVIVVGDAKSADLEALVKKIMGTVPSSDNSVVHPDFPVPFPETKQIEILKHKDQKYPIINILSRQEENKVLKTLEDCKELIADDLILRAVSLRLKEKGSASDCPWLDAGCSDYNLTNETCFNCFGIVPKENYFLQALKEILNIYDSLYEYGITEAEFKKQKENLLKNYDLVLQSKDKVESSTLCSDLVRYVLIGRVPVAVEERCKINKKIINELTLEYVNNQLKKIFPDRGDYFFAVIPESSKNIPSKNEIMEVWKNYKGTELKVYESTENRDYFMEKPANKAKITSKKKINEFDGTEYVLENGIHIITKKTDFEKNVIYMNATAIGGSNLLEEKDIPSSLIAPSYVVYSGFGDMSYIDLVRITNSKNIDFSMNIYENVEELSGMTTVQDLENLLQLVNLSFTQPRFTEEGWKNLYPLLETSATKHGTELYEVILDKIIELIYKNDVRHASFNVSYLKKINKEAAERAYRQIFDDPSKFTFVFVGDFNEKNLIEMCCYYLGTLETKGTKVQRNYVYIDYPKGIITETVKKGVHQQGIEFIGFGGNLPGEKSIDETYENYSMLNQLKAVLDIRLREVVREDLGGAYGVNVAVYIDGDEKKEFQIQISFGCEPEREEELKLEILKEIERIQKEGVSQEVIDKVNESYRRNRELNLRNNKWFIQQINGVMIYQYIPMNFMTNVDLIPSKTTSESVKQLAKKYLDTNNYVCVFLKPEN